MQPRLALIAAMQKEVAPLVRRWKAREISRDGRRYRMYESTDGAALICCGIGAEHGRRAAEALIQEVRPAKILSVGFAGALDSSLKVGDVIEPRTVVNAADGSRTDTGSGVGTMVSAVAVAGRDQKRRLASAYGAVAVDMEGAAVALAAEARGIAFGALKAISDGIDSALPPIDPFVSPQGEFLWLRFVLHVALRPWLWRGTIALAVNGEKASRALCRAIEEILRRETGGV